MRRTSSSKLIMAASTVAVLGLSACGGSANGAEGKRAGECALAADNTVVAVGARSNMKTVSVESLNQYVKPAMAGSKKVTLVDTAGEPKVLATVDFKSESANDQAKADDQSLAASVLTKQLSAEVSSSAEANPLKALDIAGRELASQGGAGTIVLVDSGLQTTGALNYTKGDLLSADPSDIAKSLQAKGQLPDLSNMTVVLMGVGDTATPQQPLDTGQQDALRDQWQAIVEQAGAACVYVDPAPLTGDARAGAPAVSVVKVPETQAIAPAKKVVLDSSTVPFKTGSAELREPGATRTKLTQIAEQLKASGAKITLTGTTATDGDSAYQKSLSEQRAQTVKGVLVDLGVSAQNITTLGVGIENPEHVKDVDSEGHLIPELAAKNRTVVLRVQ